MDKLYEMIRERFIFASNGKFLEWPADEQEAAIRSVAESVNATMDK